MTSSGASQPAWTYTGSYTVQQSDLDNNGIDANGVADGDGDIKRAISDAVFLLRFNFAGLSQPPCLAACDANGDGEVIGLFSDALFILSFNFLGGPRPTEPFPDCGSGSATDAVLGCSARLADCQ